MKGKTLHGHTQKSSSIEASPPGSNFDYSKQLKFQLLGNIFHPYTYKLSSSESLSFESKFDYQIN